MAVKLRLKRQGSKNKPFYRLVAAEQANSRNGKAIDLLGIYNPKQKPVLFQCIKEKIDYWLSVGAIPSDTVLRLFEAEGISHKYKSRIRKYKNKKSNTSTQNRQLKKSEDNVEPSAPNQDNNSKHDNSDARKS